ncbi:hypothetical protein V1478_011134, partial [Vespula squamosa]
QREVQRIERWKDENLSRKRYYPRSVVQYETDRATRKKTKTNDERDVVALVWEKEKERRKKRSEIPFAKFLFVPRRRLDNPRNYKTLRLACRSVNTITMECFTYRKLRGSFYLSKIRRLTKRELAEDSSIEVTWSLQFFVIGIQLVSFLPSFHPSFLPSFPQVISLSSRLTFGQGNTIESTSSDALFLASLISLIRHYFPIVTRRG